MEKKPSKKTSQQQAKSKRHVRGEMENRKSSYMEDKQRTPEGYGEKVGPDYEE